MVALDDGPLEWIPTWTCLDYTPGLVEGFDISRGRQTERDRTDTSSARVYLQDTDGLFDPANTGSPYFGKLDGAQIALQIWDPIEEEWVRQYRGRIVNPTYDFLESTDLLSNVQLECVGIFDWLARTKMVVGVFGDTPTPIGYEGSVWYDGSAVDDRIVRLLIEAGLVDSDWYVVFTGNVDVQSMSYLPSEDILNAIRDACDAELPGIANCYEDKLGRFVFHGRGASFDPDTVAAGAGAAWNFTRWKAGDGAAILSDPTRAQIRPPLGWARALDNVVNSAYCTPRGLLESGKPAQVFEDSGSIAKYGRRPWQSPGLIIAEGTTTGNTAAEECAKFAELFVTNLAEPLTRVERLTLKSISSAHDAAEATWAMICNADISDAVDLEHGYPGGVGISENFFIQGSEMSVRPLNGEMDMVEVSFNVTPEAAWADDVGLWP